MICFTAAKYQLCSKGMTPGLTANTEFLPLFQL